MINNEVWWRTQCIVGKKKLLTRPVSKYSPFDDAYGSKALKRKLALLRRKK